LSGENHIKRTYDLNDQDFEEAIERLPNQREEYVRETIREIWHLPLLKNFAKKFLYIEIPTPSTTLCQFKEGKYFIMDPFKLKCKPESLSKVFLRQ